MNKPQIDYQNALYFYSHHEKPHGVFSNFSAHAFMLDGISWATSEHYFQAQKFIHSPKDFESVRLAKTPSMAAKIGRNRSLPLRDDWEQVKDDVMRKALFAKFSQHEYLKILLISTKDRYLIEKTTYDYYWGIGTNGNGKNMLGVLLMELRTILAANDANSS